MSPKLSPPKIGDVLARQGEDIDTRYHPSAAVRRQLNKVFPTHWSFLLGEIAMYSFIVLLLTGVFIGVVIKRHEDGWSITYYQASRLDSPLPGALIAAVVDARAPASATRTTAPGF